MRALLCHAFGEPSSLVVESIDDPVPGPRDVALDVVACGVNFPDVLIVEGKYQYTPSFPFSPGGEVAGVVRAVGDEVTGLGVGDRVVAVAVWGGMAETMVVDAGSVTPVPEGVSMVSAAATMLAHGTAYHALKDRACLRPGETLLVLGAGGGVGLAAVELGRLLGARVIAAASSDEKLERCLLQGAHDVIDLRDEALRKRIGELTGGAGVDVCFDPVGDATEAVVRSMAWRGRYLVVGFAGGEVPRLPSNLLLLKGCAALGVFWGAFREREPELARANATALVAWLAAGRIRPFVSATYPLDRATAALSDIRRRRAVGKLVVTIEASAIADELPSRASDSGRSSGVG